MTVTTPLYTRLDRVIAGLPRRSADVKNEKARRLSGFVERRELRKSAQKLENLLALLVGQSENAGAGGVEDLSAGEFAGFLREVSVTDL